MKVSRNKKIKKENILLLIGSLSLAIMVMEVGSKILLNTNRIKNASMNYYLNQKIFNINPSLSNNIQQRLVPNPYSLYKNNPNYISKNEPKIKQFDKNGYRNPDYSKNNNCFKIIAFGGSTTQEYPYVKRTESWTMQLKDMLNNKFKNEKCFIIYNAGLPFGTSAELLTEYIFNGKYLNPDLIIIHTGVNDAVALLQKEYKTDYSHIRARGNIGTGFMYIYGNGKIGKILRSIGDFSSTIKLIYYIVIKFETGFDPVNGGVTSYTPAISGVLPLSPDDSLRILKERDHRAFESNITTIVEMAKINGSKVLLVPLIQASRDKLTLWPENKKGYEDVLIASLEKHTQILKKISLKTKSNFFKFNRTLFEDKWFIDNCHLNPKGSKEKANQLFNYLVKTEKLLKYNSKSIKKN